MWDPELVALAFCLQEISPPKDIWMRHAYLTYDYLTSTREGGNWDGESVLVGLVITARIEVVYHFGMHPLRLQGIS